MKKILQAPIFAITLGGVCFLLTTAVLLKEGMVSRAEQAHVDNPPTGTVKFWDAKNVEIDQMVDDLKKEKSEMDGSPPTSSALVPIT